jgi:hypothetical protein
MAGLGILLLLYPFCLCPRLGILPLGSSPAEIDHGSSHPGPPPPLLLLVAGWILPQLIGIEANTERWTEKKVSVAYWARPKSTDGRTTKGSTYQPAYRRFAVLLVEIIFLALSLVGGLSY